MKITLLTVGAPGHAQYEALIREYLRRLQPYLPAALESIAPEKIASRSDDEVRRREAMRIRERLPKQHLVVAMDRSGDGFDSDRFRRWLERSLASSRKGLVFVIGGPLGLEEALVREADQALSMSPWTFAHELAAVVLLEQLYRAMNHLRGGKYHK